MPSPTTDAELRSFLGPDGKTTRDGQRRAGMFEAAMRRPLTARRPWESKSAFAIRAIAYRTFKLGGGHLSRSTPPALPAQKGSAS